MTSAAVCRQEEPSGGAAFEGLNAGNFRVTARNGFGDPHNTYPHAMTWFRDRLYVSTTRDNLVMIKLRYPFEIPFACWPVPVPRDLWDLDLRARIFRYDPGTDAWSEAFASPMVIGRDRREIPLSIAFRSMTVFQGTSDRAPALYTLTHAPALLTGAVMLRSADGATFEVVSEPGLGAGDWRFRSFRSVISFKGRLFAAPTMGAQSGRPNDAGVALVLASSDPARGDWRIANEPNFGDPRNLTVFEMTVFDGCLYAGTANLEHGFEIWKTDADGDPPFRWRRVLARGAYRGKLNQGTVSMVPFRGNLYVGTGIQGGGYDRVHNVGPAAPELIRLYPDDSWELIVGEPRLTPDGMKVPLSGMGPGFYNPFSGYFWMMCEHDGWLYLGTYDSSTFLPYASLANLPDWLRAMLDRIGIERLVHRWGGFDLWRSHDGTHWVPVCRNGLGNRFNYGVRTMVSTAHGLFLGATNPFGPDVAVQRAGGWRYEPNPGGGLEIWLGTRSWIAPPRPEREDPILVRGEAGSDGELCERLIEEYYGGSGFRHVGWWREDIREAAPACENLVEELLSLLPAKDGTVLDVGCGLGGTTRLLLRQFPAGMVTAVGADKRALRAGRPIAPGATFRRASLPWLDFREGSFDCVLCVEPAVGAEMRERLLEEVFRVLKPGGCLAFADLLTAADGEGQAPSGTGKGSGPIDAGGYRALLERMGFVEVAVRDETEQCWARYREHASRHFAVKLLAGDIDVETLNAVNAALPGHGLPVACYLIGIGKKPLPPERA